MAQQLFDIGVQDPVADVAVEYLASLVHDPARAAFDLLVFRFLIVRHQCYRRAPAIDLLLNRFCRQSRLFGDLTQNRPLSDVGRFGLCLAGNLGDCV